MRLEARSMFKGFFLLLSHDLRADSKKKKIPTFHVSESFTF